MKKTCFTLLLCIVVTYFAQSQQWGDYTLIAIQNNSTTTLVDTNGTTYKTWTHSSSAKIGYSAYMMPGGYLWRSVAKSGTSFTGGPICGEVQKVDYQGNIVWDFVYSTTNYCTHHDFCPLPNGNVLLISYDRKTSTEVAAAGGSYSGEMWSEKIVEVQPTGSTTGTVVWEWKLWDHLCQGTNASKPHYVTSFVNNPQWMNINYHAAKDWVHMNGIDYNPILDQIVVSSHNLNESWIIDHSTTTAEAAGSTGGNAGKGGDFLYRWGNPAAYGATGTTIFNVVHDAHWIPEGVPNAGRLVYFNNKGQTSPTTKSTIDQISAPLSGYNSDINLGSAYTPTTYASRLVCNGYSTNMGSSQQLPNGNMLIAVATTGLIYETNPSGTSIWSKTVSGSIPQASRYSKCYIDNPAPAIPTITENAGVLTSSSATTYQWYKNGQLISGATSQTYTPAETAIYVVRITDTNGCVYMYSLGYKFTYTTVSMNSYDNILSNIKIYPNPSNGLFNVDVRTENNNYLVEVFNIIGNKLISERNCHLIDLNSFESGMYLVQVTFENKQKTIKKTTLIK